MLVYRGEQLRRVMARAEREICQRVSEIEQYIKARRAATQKKVAAKLSPSRWS